jgi:hypothetical protein
VNLTTHLHLATSPFHHTSSWSDAQLIKHRDNYTDLGEEDILGDLKEDRSSRQLIFDSTEEGEEE